MIDQRRRGLGGDALSPRLAREPVSDLDVSTIRHRQQQAHAVHRAIGLALGEPPSGLAMVGLAAPPDALHGLDRRLHAGWTPHELHHAGIAVESDQRRFVVATETAEAQTARFDHGAIILSCLRARYASPP